MPEDKFLKVIWTVRAIKNYEKIIQYILDNFSIKQADILNQKIDKLIHKISIYQHICPLSQRKDLHKCIVNRNTALVYYIKNNELQIISIFDNRNNSSY